jgi:tetratricopeptide (TPR) repeat protein
VPARRGRAKAPSRTTVRELNTLGVHFFRIGAHELAVREFQAALRLLPDSAVLRFNLGACLFEMRRDLEAADAFAAAVQEEPGHRRARLYLGVSLARLGRRQEAIPHLRRVAAEDPEGEDGGLARATLAQIARDRLLL